MVELNRKPGLGKLLPWLLLLLLPWVSGRASAQTAYSASIINFDLSGFPRMTAYLNIQDERGDFVPGIQANRIAVFENGIPHPLTEFTSLNSGVAFALVLNPGSSFAIRDSQGLSRYDYLLEAIRGWGLGQEEERLDDLSLLISSGPEMYHLIDAAEWLEILESFQTDFRFAQPNLDVLDRAIDITTGPSLRPGMGRAILLVTPPLDGDFSLGLQNLAARARQQGVRIFVWMVASPDVFESRSAGQLAELASQTGGSFFAFSGVEPVPDLEVYLEPLRSIYQIGYDSRIDAGGSHELFIEIYPHRVWEDEVYISAERLIATAPITFDLEIQPPSVVFVSPPTVVERIDGNPEADDPLALYPLTYTFEFLIEFPDRLPRSLVSTTLFVNGTPVVQRTEHPFDQLEWNLSGYFESADYSVHIEAVDNLGLVGTSIDIPISILITHQPRSLVSMFTDRMPLLVGLVVFILGLVLFLVLILGGRLRPKVFSLSRKRMAAGAAQALDSSEVNDPQIQPAGLAEDQPSRFFLGWMNPMHWPQRATSHKAIAYLTCFSEKDREKMLAPLPLSSDEVSLGRDRQKSILVLDDPSVEACHARLQKEGESYRILDEGSIAGTWVNYAPVEKEGTLLEHGDLVHIGRLGFHFQLKKPAQNRKPKIIPQDPSR